MTRAPTVTIRDVARQAGVSIATVSRALNSSDLVAGPTRDRVVAAARMLGYQPNRAARGRRLGPGGLIGVLAPDLANPFFLGLLKGVQTQARGAGRHVLVADSAEDAEAEAALIRLITRQADGLVLLSSRLDPPRLRALTGPCRTVLVNRVLPGFPSVLLDFEDGMRQTAGHLAALGHRRCGYAGGPVESFADLERRRGLAAGAEQGGLRLIYLGAFSPGRLSGARVADLAVAAGVTCVIAFNDLMALGVLGRLRELGVRVPAEMSVTGFDDILPASLGTPGLTTVAAPLTEAGRTAVMLLHRGDEHAGPDPRGHILPVRLVARGSTGPPPGPGRRSDKGGTI